MSFKSRYRLTPGPLSEKKICSKCEINNMKITQRVRKILSNYESDNPGSKTNLARILMTGKLAGTGKMLILTVDQGW